MTEPISSGQRFTRRNPCPICSGYDDRRLGEERCFDFLSSDGAYAHCTRSDHAGDLERHEESLTYAHHVESLCRCGQEHSAPPAPPVKTSPARTPVHPEPGVVKAYRYVNEAGAPLFAVLRYANPKRFILARPAVADPGPALEDWWRGLAEDTRRVLYHLDELVQAPSDVPVWLCEGEKDADALRELGLLATTCPMGAEHWQEDYAQALAGRTVVILGDNDRAGRAGAQRREKSLRKVAAAVRVHVFSDLPEGGDVSDWIAAGGTKEELLKLPGQDTRHPRLRVLNSMEDVVEEPVEWLWYPRIPLGKLVILEGDPGLGKSVLTCVINAAISRGWPLPGNRQGEREPGRILMLADEDGYGDTVKPRLRSLGADLGAIRPVLGLIHENEEMPLTLSPEGVQAIEAEIVSYKPTFITIDPLFSYIGGKPDINKGTEVRAVLRPLTELCEKHRVTILAVRHLNKAAGTTALYRGQGNIDFVGAARSVLQVREDVDVAGRAYLTQIKTNLSEKAKPVPFRIANGEAGLEFFWEEEAEVRNEDVSDEDEKTALTEARDFLRQVLKERGRTGKDVQHEARQAGVSDRTLWRAKAGLRVRAKRCGGEWVWSLPASADTLAGLADLAELENGADSSQKGYSANPAKGMQEIDLDDDEEPF